MATVIVSSTPKPVKFYCTATIASTAESVHFVGFYIDDEGVDLDQVSAIDGKPIPADVMNLLDSTVLYESGEIGFGDY